MKLISELTPFSEQLEIVRLPSARLIGRQTRSGGALGNTAIKLWDEIFGSSLHKELLALPQIGIPELLGWTCERDKQSDTFVYIVGVLTPENTTVPEGMIYRDVPETLCAVGLYGEDVYPTCMRAEECGYETNWDALGCGWNAELSFSAEEAAPPKADCPSWHWLVPIRKK